MPDIAPYLKLTAAGALKILDAAAAKAEAMGVGVSIAVVDEAGDLLAFARMDGAKFLSVRSTQIKARSAATHRTRTGTTPHAVALELGLITQGEFVNLKGAAPIIVNGLVIGAVAAGSATGEQDLEIAIAGISALPGSRSE